MPHTSRRQFLADVGKSMLAAGLGAELAADFGFANLAAAEPPKALDFGDMETLVCLMQETPPNKLLPALVIDESDVQHIVRAFDQVIAGCHKFPGAAWDVGRKVAIGAMKYGR